MSGTQNRKIAQQAVLESRTIRLPGALARINGKVEIIMWPSNWTYTSATAEPMIGPVRPDVLIFNEFRRIAIYINRVIDVAKAAQIAEIPLDAAGIVLTGAGGDPGRIRDKVLRTAPRTWIYSGILARAQAERERLFAKGALDQKPGSGWIPEDSPVVAVMV